MTATFFYTYSVYSYLCIYQSTKKGDELLPKGGQLSCPPLGNIKYFL